MPPLTLSRRARAASTCSVVIADADSMRPPSEEALPPGDMVMLARRRADDMAAAQRTAPTEVHPDALTNEAGRTARIVSERGATLPTCIGAVGCLIWLLPCTVALFAAPSPGPARSSDLGAHAGRRPGLEVAAGARAVSWAACASRARRRTCGRSCAGQARAIAQSDTGVALLLTARARARQHRTLSVLRHPRAWVGG
jgi:hypothetical protein